MMKDVTHSIVIPAKAGIQFFGSAAHKGFLACRRRPMDPGLRRDDGNICIAILFLIFLLLPLKQTHAEPEAVVDLAEDFIPVTEDFDGAKMTVFGALRSSKSDIAVVFEGPPAKALVRAKIKQMGIWINGEPQTFEPVPSFYAVLSSQPLDKMMKPEALAKLGLGLNVATLNGEAGQGLVQNRKAKGMYIEDGASVKIRDKKLFRADIQLPPNVPVGTYKATIYEVKDGLVAASRQTSFTVKPIGMANIIRRMAFENPVSYSAIAIVFVLLIGGVAAHLFRKAS